MPAERRRVTVLFPDLVGYSTLAEHMDPEELQALVVSLFSEVTREVERRGGLIEKFMGDAAMAVFGAPEAHEDDPIRAVEAALAIQRIVASDPRNPSSGLRFRFGIQSGLVVSGGVGDGTQPGVVGDAVNVAARLQQLAEPGEILVGAPVWRRIRDVFDVEPVGTHLVKGRDQPVEAYRVVGRREGGGRTDPPFVGRRDETALLELLWTSAAKGNTHVVSIVGDAGVGKSRLLSEFHPAGAALDIRLSCRPDRTFGLFLDLIETILGRLPRDLEDLHAILAELDVPDEIDLLLGTFLGLADAPPVVGLRLEQQQLQVFGAVLEFVRAAPRGRPMFLAIDDLEHADQSSLDLLWFVLERVSGVPLLLVLAQRPAPEEHRPSTRASHTEIQLDVLTGEESGELARSVLSVTDVPPDLLELVATRAEGNPFFIQELLLMLMEFGALTTEDGRAVLGEVDVEVPDTVEGAIMARFDRLEPSQRTMLQHAAVIGRTFSTPLLESALRVSGAEDTLARLAWSRLVTPAGQGQWRFKHALIQEVIYSTLLRQQRREIHNKVGQALEKHIGDDPAVLDLLAEHFARAEVMEKARVYALAAGDVASERMGFVEAKRRYETALRLWGEGDEEGRLSLLMKLGHASSLAAPHTAPAILVEAEAGWRALGNLHQAGAATAALGRAYFLSGEVERATGTLRRAIAALESEGPSRELVQAYVWISIADILVGRASEGATSARRGLEMAERMDMVAARSHLENSIGMFEVLSGDLGGLARLDRALRIAEGSGEPEAIARVHLNRCTSLGMIGRNRDGIDGCREGREVAAKLGASSFEWVIAGQEAIMLAELGRLGEAEALAREILGPQRSLVVGFSLVLAGIALGMVLSRRGEHDQARAALDDVLPTAAHIGGPIFLLPVRLVEADMETARGNPTAARHAMADALRVVGESKAMEPTIRAVVPAVRLGMPGWEELLDGVRAFRGEPFLEAMVTEADAIARHDPQRFHDAAELYRSAQLPYQEARCRREAGEADEAKLIEERFGFVP